MSSFKQNITVQLKIIILLVHIFPFKVTGHETTSRFDERLISNQEIQNLLAEAKIAETAYKSADVSVSYKKPWTVIVYIAADNNLHPFAWKNLKQMETIGSNPNLNIVVQINTPGKHPTKRYIVHKGRRFLVEDSIQLNTKLNSGCSETLIDCVQWAVESYPAENYALIFWNHGSAAIDPIFNRAFNPCDLFFKDPVDNSLSVDRGIHYIALLSAINGTTNIAHHRGICFDDTFKSYINNTDLNKALHRIQNSILHKKWGVIAFDACLMSMIEISSIVKNYAEYMAASEEVVYGTGQNYELMLKPFETTILSPKQFAQHIVQAYEQTYQKIINDYTFSALDLSKTYHLEENINKIAQLLIYGLKNQHNLSVTNIIRKCKSVQYCTCFDEPTYIDLAHFYSNLQSHIHLMDLRDKAATIFFQHELQDALHEGLIAINQCVIINRVGPKQQKAHGISIYFPEFALASSYNSSPFALNNDWGKMLTMYLIK